MSDVKKSSTYRRSTCYLLNIKQPEKTWKRLKVGFQRTYGTITILKQGRSMEAAVGFVDVSDNSTSLYTPELLHKGTQIEICIIEPFLLRVTGLVSWSVPVYTGIHGGKFKFRSGVQFIFESEQTRLGVQEFVRKVALDPMESIKNAMAAQAAASAPAAAPPEGDKPAEPALAPDPGIPGATPATGDKPAEPPTAGTAPAEPPGAVTMPPPASPETAAAPMEATGAVTTPPPMAEAPAAAPSAAPAEPPAAAAVPPGEETKAA